MPTLSKQLKTDPGMLPQSQALEAPVADTPRVGPKRAGACAAAEHGRGERSERATARNRNPRPAASVTDGETDGVTHPVRHKPNRVFVLSSKGQPLMPCHPARARMLKKAGKTRVARLIPMAVRLKDRTKGTTQKVILKTDPGSKTTGIALVREDQGKKQHLLHGSEITHRGAQIRKKMGQRAGYRRRRRSKNLRYRAPRFLNRKRKEGWLPPSLRSRVEQVRAWFIRYGRLLPVAEIWIEGVRFDMQALLNPEVSGVEYQQGELHGYEVREYLLEKWGRKCTYCSKENVPLEIEHIFCKASGGSNRVSNLTLACHGCNQKKKDLPVETFVKDPTRLKRILSQAQAPLRDTAAVNTTRNALVREAKALGLPVRVFTGGRTKFNRSRLGVPKTHMLDAACVGDFGILHGWDGKETLSIKAMGRGAYQRTRVTAHGFPRGFLMRGKSVQGFRTGDHVKAVVPSGKKQGTYRGRVAVRASGSFNLQFAAGPVQGISYRHCRLLQHADGYQYETQIRTTTHTRNSSPTYTSRVEGGVSLRNTR